MNGSLAESLAQFLADLYGVGAGYDFSSAPSVASPRPATRASSRRALAGWLAQSDALAYAKGKASWYADLALQELRTLPATPAREVLEALTRFVVARSE